MRVVTIVAASLCLAGCSSTSSMTDWFKSTPPQVDLQLDSTPPGADAVTSLGQSCKTPCKVSVAAKENFTVTFNLPKYQPETVPVNVVEQSGGAPVLDPNPVTAELQPATPPKKPKKKPHVARAPKPAAATPAGGAAAPAAAPAQNSSPFPAVQ
jgi:hypothetical protein